MLSLSRRSLRLAAVLLGVSAGGLSGCALAPQSQLDECRQRGQALRTENDRLKDQVLTLRSENQDSAQRSVDDERRLKAQEAAIERLEQSVEAYRNDREQLASAQERLKGQIQATAGSEASRLPDALERFAQGHSGTSFDSTSGVLTLPVDQCFAPGAAKLRGDADGILKDLAAALASPDLRQREVVVAAPAEDAAVQRASLGVPADAPARQRFLAMARATQVRERLASTAGIAAERIRIADPDDPLPKPGVARGNTAADLPRVEVRLAQAAAHGGPSGP